MIKRSGSLSLSTDAFTSACEQIRDIFDGYMPFITAWNWPGVRAPEIREEHVHQAATEAIEWAKAQDLHQGLLEHAALPTTAYGLLPSKHLASLALLGDVARLKSYQASFAAGDCLGFHSRITKDYIDRAVALAEQHANPPTTENLGH